MVDSASKSAKRGASNGSPSSSPGPTNLSSSSRLPRDGYSGTGIVGDVRLSARRDAELRPVFTHSSGELLCDWDVVENLWAHAFSEQCLNVDPQDTPCVVTVPTDASSETIAKYLEIMFERFQVPAAFVLRKAVACAFAAGKTTALVLDSGATGTVAATVYDGFVLKRTSVRSPLGGHVLDNQVLKAVEAESGAPVRPRFLFVKKRDVTGVLKAVPVDSVGAATFVGGSRSSAGLTSVHAHPTALAEAKLRIARDIKEEHFCVPHTAYNEILASTIPKAVYELPDGTPVHLGTCRYSIPELLMNPGPLSDPTMVSVPDVVLACLGQTPADVRRDAAAQLLLTGGNTCIDGFHQRLNLELTSKLANKLVKFRQHIPAPIERKAAGFMGASVLGSLGSFQQLWISTKMYTERGAHGLANHYT